MLDGSVKAVEFGRSDGRRLGLAALCAFAFFAPFLITIAGPLLVAGGQSGCGCPDDPSGHFLQRCSGNEVAR